VRWKIAYLCPSDDQESERLDMQSVVLAWLLGGLHLSPVAKDRRIGNVLDVCCGTGTWAIEMAEEYPESIIKGADLAPIQPVWVPPNVQFYVDDM
jgi:metalloendopeptidase OMA1, mitochondrial